MSDYQHHRDATHEESQQIWMLMDDIFKFGMIFGFMAGIALAGTAWVLTL